MRGHGKRLSAPSDSMYLVSITPPRVLRRSFWNCTVFVMVWRCACDLDIVLTLSFNIFPHYELNHFFIIIFPQFHFIFQTQILSKCICSGTLFRNSYNLSQLFWNCTCVFIMVWNHACDLDIILRSIFITFFHVWNLIIFFSLFRILT